MAEWRVCHNHCANSTTVLHVSQYYLSFLYITSVSSVLVNTHLLRAIQFPLLMVQTFSMLVTCSSIFADLIDLQNTVFSFLCVSQSTWTLPVTDLHSGLGRWHPLETTNPDWFPYWLVADEKSIQQSVRVVTRPPLGWNMSVCLRRGLQIASPQLATNAWDLM